ncbi:MAG: hypothetical protein IJR31_05015 [Lachnospiraceae bacterium]|nr:hypothetical protein [Lachnospiraceae bacterium]
MSGIEGINNGPAMVQQDTGARGSAAKVNEGGREDSGSLLFAGNLNLPQAPANKIEAARKQAMKLVTDAFETERNTDKGLTEIRERRADVERDLAARREMVSGLKDSVSSYAKKQGITEDSREQKDLDILRKVRGYGSDDLYAAMTDPLSCLNDDERKRYAAIMDEGLTEYQKLALDADNEIRNARIEIDQDKEMIRAYNIAIRDVKLESLKDQSMVKAQKGKDEIMQTASKDVISSLVQEAVQHIDEELEEVKEEAEEKAEKRAEEKEKAAEREEEKKEKEILEGEAKLERLNSQSVSYDQQGQVNTEIQNILNKLSLLEDDIKGIEVNKQL